MGIKEGASHDDWAMYTIAESLHCTPETNRTFYIDYTGI